MDFQLNEEQRMLQDSARRYLETECGTAGRNAAIAGGGFDATHWQMFADMGWLGLSLPEEHGGLGGSMIDVAILMQEIGRVLCVEPFWAIGVLAAQTIIASGDEAKMAKLLPALAEGKLRPVLAHGEDEARGAVEHVATRAVAAGEGRWRLSGTKSLVVGGNQADCFIVSARTAGAARDRDGITLFVVPKDAKGLRLHSVRLIDNRWCAHIDLDNVEVGLADMLGAQGQGYGALAPAYDLALIALCAEAVGIMEKSVDITGEYIKVRKQFGTTLASFQALQHRIADMLIETELSRCMVHRGLAALSLAPTARTHALAATKYHIGKSGKFVCGQAIQLHGGIGVTEEYTIGHYYKRMIAIEFALGDSQFHLERMAEMERAGTAAVS